MSRVDNKFSLDAVAGSPVCPHLIPLVKLCGQIFTFSKNVRSFMNKMLACDDISSERNIVCFHGRFYLRVGAGVCLYV